MKFCTYLSPKAQVIIKEGPLNIHSRLWSWHLIQVFIKKGKQNSVGSNPDTWNTVFVMFYSILYKTTMFWMHSKATLFNDLLLTHILKILI